MGATSSIFALVGLQLEEGRKKREALARGLQDELAKLFASRPLPPLRLIEDARARLLAGPMLPNFVKLREEARRSREAKKPGCRLCMDADCSGDEGICALEQAMYLR